MNCSTRGARQLLHTAGAIRTRARVPKFLCPTLAQPVSCGARCRTTVQSRHLCTSKTVRSATNETSQRIPVNLTSDEPLLESSELLPQGLPLTCPGCGAYAQTANADAAGYYSPNRIIKIRKETRRKQIQQEKDISEGTSQPAGQNGDARDQSIPPICSRCNSVMNNNTGPAIHNPSIRDIYEVIASSPHKKNHVYHVIDAADFPLSMVSNITAKLELARQRTRNRRARDYEHTYPWENKPTNISYIITRADLLAPTKEKVDQLMPYFVGVLRERMGRQGDKLRLGNVHCVSATRGWWTKSIKDKIVENGGAGWMVGKVNVGKSMLLSTVFPRGIPETVVELDGPPQLLSDEILQHSTDVLPPAQAVVPYPYLPTVSGVAGTTALPIRIPYHGGRGELVDLPGIDRTDLTTLVKPEHRSAILMTKRIQPQQHVLKPQQSLLLGGIIRISPVTEHHFLTYPYVTIKPHVGSTERMISVQDQSLESGVENIALPGVGQTIVSAGRFKLTQDVTKQRAGPLLRHSGTDDRKLKVRDLPFVTYSTDILIEGLGWVEIAADVRRKHVEAAQDEDFPVVSEIAYPEVEVFVPEGLKVGSRRPMGAWMISKQGKPTKPKGQPRRRRRDM